VNEELKRKNYDLQRQIDKWQRLEDKSDAELDSVHKRKSELEVELKELRDRLARAKEDGSKALEKEKKRVERAKEAALGWQVLNLFVANTVFCSNSPTGGGRDAPSRA
jgi:predicted  nucleic acid-binding Zn-ribbon protein